MSTAVIIHLDYLLSPAEACQKAWKVLQQSFVDAGFSEQERLFTINQPYDWGALLAEEAMRVADQALQQQGLVLADVLRNCQAFEFQQAGAIESPAPSTGGIEVSFVETGAWLARQ